MDRWVGSFGVRFRLAGVILARPGGEGAHSRVLRAGRSLGLDDSVPSGIIMRDRVESSRLLALGWTGEFVGRKRGVGCRLAGVILVCPG